MTSETSLPIGLRVTLTVLEGPHQGETFTFAEHDTFLVGRAPEAHFCLPDDPYLSRMHFLVEVNPPRCRLLHLGGRNKTYVNGQPVEAADLHDRDHIRAGRSLFQAAIVGPSGERTGAWSGESSPGTGDVAMASMSADPRTEWPAVPGYQLLRQLGEGGMGVVYLARRHSDAVEVAVKTIRPALVPTETTVQRFLREAAILQQLKHPHIVAFHEQGEAGGLLYFVMDYVPGTDAEKLLREQGPLPLGRAVDLVCQLLEALAYAHSRGFIHRDIKPSNLLVTEVQGRETTKLADFGLARTWQASPLSGLTLTGGGGGTVPFMPPEQVLSFRTVTPSADQYSTAATLYTLLTGQSVHGSGAPAELYQRILTREPEPVRSLRPEVPAGLAEALHRALKRRPEERFADVTALRQALLPFGETN